MLVLPRRWPVAERLSASDRVRGRARLGYQDDDALQPVLVQPFRPNLVGYDWGPVVAHGLRNAPDGRRYYVGGMYIEFDNSGSAVSPPSPTRGGNTAYYANLNSSFATRDYLRVPLVATSGANSDEDLFSADNIALFHAKTTGTTGVHGLTFSDAANSRVYGLGLICFRDPDNSSLDLVISRLYFEAAEQLEKMVGRQITADWELTFD